MWTLISVRGARRESPTEAEAAAGERESAAAASSDEAAELHAVAGARTHASVAAGNGTDLGVPVLRAVDNGREPSVAVYLHPGRARVATMAAGQAAEQFDLVRAREYTSLGAAELACDDRPGFLLEISEPFLDGNGRRRNGAILFVPGLS